jgi:hypothetical protein
VRGRFAAAVLGALVLVVASGTTAHAALPARLSEQQAKRIFLADPKVRSWVQQYPKTSWVTTSQFRQTDRKWRIDVFSGKAGEIATGLVDDGTSAVVQAWTGPQVAWPLARGPGLGGAINHASIWLLFCAFFLLGLGNLRRPVSLRNLDLLALLSFSVPLWYFNHGHVFAGATLATFPLVYLLVRLGWIGARNRGPGPGTALPVWAMLAATIFLVGFRVELNHRRSSVLDVGYAGVIGADRIDHGIDPYGHFPIRNTGKPCGPADSEGNVNDWVQSNGRCESANPTGDTYGPVSYLSYLPGLWVFGWSGKWDRLPAVHATTILFEIVALLGLAAVGYRYGGPRLAALLALAWAACPFTQYVSSANTNDALMPAFLIWGFWAATSDPGRGIFTALASWTKLAALVLVPLWLTYPNREVRRGVIFAVAFGATTGLSFWVLLLGGHPLHEAQVFYDRTFKIQFDRHSPFSVWDWGQYHVDLPDLRWLQHVLQVVLVVGAVAVAFVPRAKSPLQLAAFTGALLVGFELLLTHWSALYITWFFPFFALAVLAAPELAGRREESAEEALTAASLRDVEPASSPVPAGASDA